MIAMGSIQGCRKGRCQAMSRSVYALLFAGLVTAAPAMAMERGTLGRVPGASWATPVSDRDLGSMRGGFGGLAFSVAFTGTFEHVGNLQGFLPAHPAPTQTAPPPPSRPP